MELASSLLRTVELKGTGGACAEQIEQYLQGLPADERERLQKDLATQSAPITVVTAADLTPAEQDQWIGRLSASLGQKHEVVFASDPGIVGGAELHLPHAVVKFTWADQLQKARELLESDEAAS
jgi:F-type H+-transporting ATPase subunit b